MSVIFVYFLSSSALQDMLSRLKAQISGKQAKDELELQNILESELENAKTQIEAIRAKLEVFFFEIFARIFPKILYASDTLFQYCSAKC